MKKSVSIPNILSGSKANKDLFLAVICFDSWSQHYNLHTHINTLHRAVSKGV